MPQPTETSPATAQSSTLKRINMRRFLEEVRQRGPSTRAELSRATGVAAPTSSTIIADLVASGLVEEAEIRSAGKGRPGRLYRMATQNVYILGATVGPEECVVAPALLTGGAIMEEAHSFSTPTDYEALLQAINSRVDDIKTRRRGKYLGFATSVPGLIHEQTGEVALSPNLHVTDGKPLGRDLADLLELDVHCIQEEHALCLAEQNSGQGKGLTDYVVLDVTYGMGMGVVSGGQYVSGRDGFAGEIGHVTAELNGALCGCGNRGCFETVATDMALFRQVRCGLASDATFADLVTSFKGKRIDITAELDRTMDYLAVAVAAAINIFNPEAVLIHSRLFELGETVLPELAARAKGRSLKPSRDARILAASSNRLDGVLAGLLNQVFVQVGPKLI